MNILKTAKMILSLMLLVSGAAIASPNMNTIYVQGYLRKATGSAVTDGNYAMTISVRSGATYFWTKGITVAVSGGFFSQSLSGASSAPYAGSIDSATLAAAAAGNLAINVQTTIDGQAVSFDVQASPVPLALLSDKANSVVAGAVDSGALASGAVTAAKLASSGTLPGWDGSALTNITAANITGTLGSSNFPSTLPTASGANLTDLNATELTSGTLPSAVFPATLPAVSGANLTSLPAANLTGTLPAISGANLTSLPAANLTGTLPAISGANLTNLSAANLTGTLPALSGANLTNLPAANLTGTLPALDGSALTNLNATNLASGTVPAARIPTTLSGATTFSAAGTALTVTNNASVGGTLGVTGNTTLGGTLTLPNTATITSAGTTSAAVTISATGAGGGVTITPNAASGTFTGSKGYAGGTQSVTGTGGAYNPAGDGSAVMLFTANTSNTTIATISGCNSGLYAQGQMLTFILVGGGGAFSVTFTDTAVGTATADAITLSAAYATGAFASTTARGSTLQLVCTTIAGTKKWVEVSRSINAN